MQISEMTYYLVNPGKGKNLCFVKLETDEGIHGWGECYTQSDRDIQITAHLDALKRYLIGRDPSNIKHFMQVVYDDFAGRRGAMDLWSAVSGIEQAMWDILGKHLKTPVYTLLGGAVREKIRVYANGWGGGEWDSEDLASRAKKVVESGFTALKFYPVPGPWRTYISKDVEKQTIKNVRAVRDAVGQEIDILIEMHRRLAPMHAIKIAKEIEQYNPFWYEEPVLAENVNALTETKLRVNLPVVTGEELYTKFEFREIFEKRAADIINPDVCNVGGILELKEIAAMAEPYFIAVSPHNYNSTSIGLAATIQVSATIPNFLITEYFINFEEFSHKATYGQLSLKEGYIEIPKSPGLGIDLNEKVLNDYPYRQFPLRKIRDSQDEGP